MGRSSGIISKLGKYLLNFLPIEDVCPAEPHKKYEFVQKLRDKGLSEKVALGSVME